MNLRVAAWSIASLLLGALTIGSSANAQNPPEKLKEVQLGANAFSLGDPVPAWVDAAAIPSDTRNDPVLYRLMDTQWLVGGTNVLHVHRAVTVNDTASLSNAGQLPIPFVPEYQQLRLHAIKIHRGDETLDRTTSSNMRFLQREDALEQGVYSGIVTVSVLINDVRLGDTIEYAYSIYGDNPVFGGKFAEASGWDQSLPILLRRVIVNYPSERRLNWRMIGDSSAPAVVPQEAVRDGIRTLRFEGHSMPAVASEPYTPADHTTFRWLQFSEFSQWNDIVGWADGLFKVDGALDPDLQEVVRKLRAKPTAEERVVGALEFVQSEIRYFSVSLGESSHRPTAPNVVFQRRYGDCKDKSFLLMALLKELGIESHAVLVKVGRRKGLDKLLPSPVIFDHVIVQVRLDGSVFYLDPTRLGQHGRLSRMGQVHERAQVLVIAPETRVLTTIASANPDELVRDDLTETATVSKFDADGQLKTKEVWHGAAAEALRVIHDRAPRERFVKAIGDAMEGRYPGSKLIGEPHFDDDQVENAVTVSAAYSVPKLATEKDGNWFVRFRPTNMGGALVASSSSTRTAPLVVPRFPHETNYTFEMTFPEEVSSVSDPHSDKVESKYFTYAFTSSFRGNVAKTTIEMKTLADQVEAEDLQKFTEDLQKVSNVSRYSVFVSKSAIKTVGGDAKGFAQRLRERIQETINQTSETIKGGKLTGNDLAAAYCDRSISYSYLDNRDEALRDIAESLSLAPNRELSCRGELYFNLGEYDKSIEDYSKAIRLGATRPRVYHLRGISNFLAGNLEDAASDFARGADTPDKEQQVYSDLWLTWTHQRLGTPVPEATLRRAAAQPRGDWPRPALAMLTGNLTVEELLQLLDGKNGDERQMALAEGYFYLGEHYLILDDAAKAREFFEKTVQLDVVMYTEHIAASAELRRLKVTTAVSNK